MKWPHASPRHRKGMAEGLVTATVAEVDRGRGSPAAAEVRNALKSWSFNTSARHAVPVTDAIPPNDLESVLGWIRGHSHPVSEMGTSPHLRAVLHALTLNLDGSAAAPSTIARKRSAVYSALDYAVELELLASNPMPRMKQGRSQQVQPVDRRVVVNPTQAAALIDAVAQLRASLEAFFAVLYYAGLRPAEARHLRERDLTLPAAGWGSLQLVGSTPMVSAHWTDSGASDEDRELKHRGRRDHRIVPASSQLVVILRRHLDQFSCGPDGRLFVTRTGRAGVPLAGPYAKPQSMGIVYRVWDEARRAALTDDEYVSPLGKRPYDLRHAAVSLWLNAGVPATQVAEWAGHSVNVLLRVYAKCVYGQEEAAKARIFNALSAEEP